MRKILLLLPLSRTDKPLPALPGNDTLVGDMGDTAGREQGAPGKLDSLYVTTSPVITVPIINTATLTTPYATPSQQYAALYTSPTYVPFSDTHPRHPTYDTNDDQLNPIISYRLFSQVGFPDVDLFATFSNRQATKFCGPLTPNSRPTTDRLSEDAFTTRWDGNHGLYYANPPFTRSFYLKILYVYFYR